MKKININVNKAEIKSFSVELNEGEPEVSASIGLFSEGGKQISTYTIATNSWNEETKFDLPVELVSPIMSILEVLEKVLVTHLNSNQKQIGGGNVDSF
jgi:hypothetical protein